MTVDKVNSHALPALWVFGALLLSMGHKVRKGEVSRAKVGVSV